MSKKALQKRMGQIYGVAIQQGWTPEEVMKHLNESFLLLYNEKKQEQIKKKIDNLDT